MFGEIARLMAMRMSYQDPIRIAQLKLAEFDDGGRRSARCDRADDVRKFRLDELVERAPRGGRRSRFSVRLERMGWLRKQVSIRFSTKNRWRIRRLKIEASLRRWRRFSVRYARERVWVERWLHMIDRALTKQPRAPLPRSCRPRPWCRATATAYRQGLADWHAIIDGLAKPTFDGVLPLAGSGRRRGGGPRGGLARSAADRAQAQDRGDQGEGAWQQGQTRRRADLISGAAGYGPDRAYAEVRGVGSYALCAVLTITTLSSWPARRFRLSRRMPSSSRTNS